MNDSDFSINALRRKRHPQAQVEEGLSDISHEKPVSGCVFISYSRKNEDWKNKVVEHLAVLEHEGLLEIWDDQRIDAGDDWLPEIERAMSRATVAVLLISAPFLTSNFIRKMEVPELLKRRQEEGLRVIPFIIKPCPWEQVKWLSRMQLRPKNGQPVPLEEADAAVAELVKEIAQLINKDESHSQEYELRSSHILNTTSDKNSKNLPRLIITADDLTRISGLPILATLGDLHQMTETEQTDWAFRTWRIIKGQLTKNQSDGLVFAFISSFEGEGRSTWIELLSQSAKSCGHRVLTVKAEARKDNLTSEGKRSASDPSGLARQLVGSDEKDVVHLPLPGWAWDLERRKQWQTALAHWRRIENLVLFIDLPAAADPAAFLLAEGLQNIIWLCDSGKVSGQQTLLDLKTLRAGGSQIVSAVLNREPASAGQSWFSRFFKKVI